ncbi:MAG: hypothetical protein RQ897_02240 [Thermoflexus sp.]|jgi:hypothetical protein|nr:hypothetical protein [Thermoflexus sp.]MDT7947150.1 hypothetical protein [Thermoflexus sp.]
MTRIRRFRVEDVRRIAREADFEFRLPGEAMMARPGRVPPGHLEASWLHVGRGTLRFEWAAAPADPEAIAEAARLMERERA